MRDKRRLEERWLHFIQLVLGSNLQVILLNFVRQYQEFCTIGHGLFRPNLYPPATRSHPPSHSTLCTLVIATRSFNNPMDARLLQQ
jgi:hypothetical protein